MHLFHTTFRGGFRLLVWLPLLLIAGCNPKPPAKTPATGGGSPAGTPPVTGVSNTPTSTTAKLPAAEDKVTFVDITSQAGIIWTHFSGARGRKYMPEIETPGCAFTDYDNDGKPDILLLNGADWPEVKTGRKNTRNALYQNEGNGKFKNVTAQSGLADEMYTMGVAVGDYDNDGYDDLYITCILGRSRLYRNRGGKPGPLFEEVTKQAGVDNESKWGSSAAWVDYDKDGNLDLIVGNYCKWTPQTDVRCSVYKGEKSYCTPNVYNGEPARLYRNLGGGKFKDVTKQAGIANTPGKTWGIALLDFDDDGWMDIALANDMEPNCLFHNQKDGTFKEIALMAGMALGDNGTAKAGMGIDSADIDNTGKPSVLVSNFTGEGLSLFVNQGGGQFLESSNGWKMLDVSFMKMGWGLFFLDYNLDGLIDALVGNGHLYHNIQEFQPEVSYKESPFLFRNEGGSFKEVGAERGADLVKPLVTRGCAYADIDGDGDLDVLLMENDGPPRLLRNDGGNTNRWLRIKTVGVKSNRNGIGTKIVVEANGVKQTRWVKSAASMLSSSELTVTFGLGTVEKAERVTLTWPSGQVDTYTDVPSNQVLQAKEGK